MMGRQNGFTIIEIIIGLALLSTTLLIGTMAFTSIINLHQKGEAARFVQQNGLYSMEAVERDIRNSSAVTVDSYYNPISQTGTQAGASGGNFVVLVGANQTSASVVYIYCGDPSQSGNPDCSGHSSSILRYDYGQVGSCASGEAACTDISSQDVRIVNNISGSTLFTKSTTSQPFVTIHMEVQQATAGLTPVDPGYYDYSLDSTVEVRQ